MNNITIPGFTAEASLYKATAFYSTTNYEGVRHNSIQPQSHTFVRMGSSACTPCWCRADTTGSRDPLRPFISCFRSCLSVERKNGQTFYYYFYPQCWPWEF